MKYNVYLNQGNEYLNSEKSISVNEVTETVDEKFFAHHIHMHNQLIPEQVAASVLENFGEVAAELMAQGMAIQFRKNNDVFMRLYADIHVKGGNINLARAQELDPTVTDLTMENATDLVQKAGITVRAYAECEKKFTDLLLAQGASVTKKDVIEKTKITRTEGSNNQGNSGSTNPTNPTDPGQEGME